MSPHPARGWSVAIVAALVAATVSFAVTAGKTNDRLEHVAGQLAEVRAATLIWSPLGPFAERDVTVVTATSVTVVGTKCYAEAVSVRGSAFWQSIDPPGINIPVGQGVRRRAEGCVTETFTNPIPAEAKTHPEVRLWVVSGTETPFRPNPEPGEPRAGTPLAWSTETFTVPE